MKFILGALVFGLFLSTAFSSVSDKVVTCPLGAGEDHLTIQRVMRNFGEYISDAESVINIAVNYPEQTIPESDVDNAYARLAVPIACSAAVLANPTGDLLPSEASFLTGKQRDDYIADFVYFMGEFHDQLQQFYKMFGDLRALAPAQRNYQAIYQFDIQLNQFIDHAHRKTSEPAPPSAGNAFLANDALKQNMKAASQDIKAIAASVNDPSQNQQNAALATDAAQHFQIASTMMPDSIAQMPQDQQSAALSDYQQMLAQVVSSCQQLQSALQGGDSATASSILQQLSQVKQDGHQKYNN